MWHAFATNLRLSRLRPSQYLDGRPPTPNSCWKVGILYFKLHLPVVLLCSGLSLSEYLHICIFFSNKTKRRKLLWMQNMLMQWLGGNLMLGNSALPKHTLSPLPQSHIPLGPPVAYSRGSKACDPLFGNSTLNNGERTAFPGTYLAFCTIADPYYLHFNAASPFRCIKIMTLSCWVMIKANPGRQYCLMWCCLLRLYFDVLSPPLLSLSTEIPNRERNIARGSLTSLVLRKLCLTQHARYTGHLYATSELHPGASFETCLVLLFLLCGSQTLETRQGSCIRVVLSAYTVPLLGALSQDVLSSTLW